MPESRLNEQCTFICICRMQLRFAIAISNIPAVATPKLRIICFGVFVIKKVLVKTI